MYVPLAPRSSARFILRERSLSLIFFPNVFALMFIECCLTSL